MRSLRIALLGISRTALVAGAGLALALQAIPDAEAKSGAKVSTRQGKRTYDQSCVQCHGEGKDGAPRLDVGFSQRNTDWTRRTFDPQQVLAQHKQSGHIQIPAAPGQPKLTDQDVINAVHWMMVMLRREPVR